ncbi:MAG: efflux RND transporter periplasmic adaptor subunit [Alphaproteobacteria bacterium]|nr:efflux RND transporter periplasmic adaptor subunit [Alphaproteobacteria bacterium]
MKKKHEDNSPKKQRELDERIVRIMNGLKESYENFDTHHLISQVKSIPLNMHTALIGLSILGLIGAIYMTFSTNPEVEKSPPLVQPASPPFANYLAAPGIIEGGSDNIKIGSHYPGIVSEIYVRPGDKVKKGTPLFAMNKDDLDHALCVYENQVKEAGAALQQAQAQLTLSKGKWEFVRKIKDHQTISQEERLIRENTYLSDKAALEKATLAVETAKAQLARAKVQHKNMTITAPKDGTILQINIRPGEYTPTFLDQGHILFGQTQTMQVRLDIGDSEAWRYKKGSRAKAYLRGNSNMAFDLKFARVEPFVTPKVALTGRNNERVDTRVLQVIYTFDQPKEDVHVYVGQQVDVCIEDLTPNAAAKDPS